MSQTLIPNGKTHDLEMKAFYLEEIRWYKEFIIRNPEFSKPVMDVIESYVSIYKSKL